MRPVPALPQAHRDIKLDNLAVQFLPGSDPTDRRQVGKTMMLDANLAQRFTRAKEKEVHPATPLMGNSQAATPERCEHWRVESTSDLMGASYVVLSLVVSLGVYICECGCLALHGLLPSWALHMAYGSST